MWLAYGLAVLPLLVGAGLWIRTRQVNWVEWAIGAAAGLVTAAIFHAVVIRGMTSDTETWSGRLVNATHHPYWHAEWTETETYTTTDSQGNTQTHFRTVHKSRDYPEHWTCYAKLGKADAEYRISAERFAELRRLFGAKELKAIQPHKPDFDHGDRNDYVAENHTDYTVPVHRPVSFENRVKAAPSVFSYRTVPDDVPVYPYPEYTDPFHSGRLIGTARSDLSWYELDCLNARLGPVKKINLILVGFQPDAPSDLGQLQEAKWIGGKKNDLVLCYGSRGVGQPAAWAYCFGWTESAQVKRNLESLFVTEPVSNDLWPKLDAEIRQNYELKDWSKFDYLSVEPPAWAFWVLLAVMALTQGGWWAFSYFNKVDKET